MNIFIIKVEKSFGNVKVIIEGVVEICKSKTLRKLYVVQPILENLDVKMVLQAYPDSYLFWLVDHMV